MAKTHSLFFFLRNNAIYTLALVFERSVSFLLFPLYTHLLAPTEFGVYTLILTFQGVAVFVYTLGIENGVMKFTAEFDDPAEIQSTAFWGLLGVGAFFSMVIFAMASPLSQLLVNDAQWMLLLQLVAVQLFFDNVTKFFLFSAIGQQRSQRYLMVHLLRGGLALALNLTLLLVLKMGIAGIFLGHAVATAVTAVIISVRRLKHIPFQFSEPLFRKMVKFSLPLMGASVWITLTNFQDRFLLRLFHSTAETGLYSAAYKIAMVLNLVVTAFSMSAIPFVTRAFKERRQPGQEIVRLTTLLFAVSLAITALVSLFVSDLVRLKIAGGSLIHPDYYDALPLIPLILLGYVSYGLHTGFSLSAYLTNETGRIQRATFWGFATNLVLNLLLIPRYAGWGAALATWISLTVMAAVMGAYARTRLPKTFPWIRMATVFMGVVLVLALSRLSLFCSVLGKGTLFIVALGIVLGGLFPHFKKRTPLQ